MFIGSLDHLESVRVINPLIASILASLKETLMTMPKAGRYPLDGDKLFYNVDETTTQVLAARRSEVHQNYLDIQIVLKGRERYGCALQPFVQVDDDRLATSDIAFGQVEKEKFIELSAGEFVVFPPGCPHRPLIAVDDVPEAITKVVIKVHQSLLSTENC
ncbi:YhcH/YjgK/YiaL family protein [Celerinatantimonas sp. YJH-8]|uniref:YhcH/YjgK/YiaL family protein n=1 Tax=Celerinatantimonas sp. YJH-8 TaxID=3228714 RepID=UPI0038C9A615